MGNRCSGLESAMFNHDNIQQTRKYLVGFVTTLCIIVSLVFISIAVQSSVEHSLTKIYWFRFTNDENKVIVANHDVTRFIPLLKALIAPIIAIILGIGASLLPVILHWWHCRRAWLRAGQHDES
jgi:hypothetical protein